jgi:uncharacterized repeat protein (TIGR03803 family)
MYPNGTALELRRSFARAREFVLAILILSFSAALPTRGEFVFQVVHEFEVTGNGPRTPFGMLAPGDDGNLYGVTQLGGDFDEGTVFRLSMDGLVTKLYSFNSTNGGGSQPEAGLMKARDGNIYGTTGYGGTGNVGTVFRLTEEGDLTTIYSFDGNDGFLPQAELVQGADGDLYGTAREGTLQHGGTVFKITTNGVITTLHAFTGNPDGKYPESPVMQASDGNFYGTADQGGPTTLGTLYRIRTNGVYETVAVFNGTNGSFPDAGLIEGRDGLLYGTTSGGGEYHWGTVFKMSLAGMLTTLHSFNGTNGGVPYTPLLLHTNGNFYGTTYNGGPEDFGTVFKMTMGGELTVLHYFNGTNGTLPWSGLTEGSDGNLYGMTTSGGKGFDESPYTGGGVIYRLVKAPEIVRIERNGGEVSLSWSSSPNAVYQVETKDKISDAQWLPVSPEVTASAAITSFGEALRTERYYRVRMIR